MTAGGRRTGATGLVAEWPLDVDTIGLRVDRETHDVYLARVDQHCRS
jgi:hypothetical protein